MNIKSFLYRIFPSKNSGKKVVIQTETTGLYPKDGHKLVEIAAIEIDENDTPTGAVFHAYINPERDVPEEVVKIHGLDYDFLQDYPPFAAYKNEFLNFIKGKEIIGHHILFDLNFLNNEIGFKPENKITDTLEMAKAVFVGQKNHLCALSERLNVNIRYPAYNGALLDALYIIEIYKKLKNCQSAFHL
ncbi:MAG: exonuclease domain-containing protein [Alphaproteobacteria bacterium]